MKRFLLFYLFLQFINCFSQSFVLPDTVIYYKFGNSQTFGQNSPYFPKNILGLPDTSAKWNIPSSDPEKICSIGIDGEIILGFISNPIVNKDGPDFIVYENAFEMWNGKIFVEPAEIYVSKDNIMYYKFPLDTFTLVGCAGLTPTIGNKILSDPLNSGGDKFDLSVVGIDTVLYVKIKDVSNIILNNKNHPYYNALISGFDLDGVIGLNYVKRPIANENLRNVSYTTSLYPNPTNGFSILKIRSNYYENIKIQIFNILGEIVQSVDYNIIQGDNLIKLNLNEFNSGIYIIKIKSVNINNQLKLIINK